MNALPPDVEAVWSSLGQSWSELRGRPDDADLWAQFILRCDKLMSISGEHGLTSAAVAMGPLLNRLESLQAPGPAHLPEIENLLLTIHAALQHPQHHLSEPAGRQTGQSSPLVLLYSADAASGSEIEPHMAQYGLRLERHGDAESVLGAAQAGRAAAVLVDVEQGFDSTVDAAVTEFARLGVPWCAVASQIDFALRLQALRRGAHFFFNAPLTVEALIPVIDPLAFPVKEPPFRVLILDDSRTVLSGIRRAMAPFEDIQLGILSQPHKLLEVLQFFAPDVLLLDIHMQGCTGLEVAQMIRQHKAFESIPIVFLTAETDPKAQNEAMRVGADDLLLKPVATELLYNVLTQKARRYRGLRRLMEEDSMTGLYNHGKTKALLLQLLQQAARLTLPMAYALLDIDHFKRINDTYGHGMGDKVIMSLSRHLRQRLRGTDVVGRYGGEEFALLLFNCSPAEAVQLVDELRESFSKMVHGPTGDRFSATFSGGVAFFPNCQSVPLLMVRADESLYEAKRAGRNRVMAHMPPAALPLAPAGEAGEPAKRHAA
ncbi:diguanylate cyclase [Xylophilus rhododendri]|uniref:diguanylate cyclase n=1 Tax=Xylophilus rhododendri TaxID=2697032 RepID=A0A857J7L2_9BURK|nr:diguanylate cyclase [Xylophilus rhododendri]QHI98758.1 diguanylate cyclase [Xylophilus rhododendri]